MKRRREHLKQSLRAWSWHILTEGVEIGFVGFRGLQDCNYCMGIPDTSLTVGSCVSWLHSTRQAPLWPLLAPGIQLRITKDQTRWVSPCCLLCYYLSDLEKIFQNGAGDRTLGILK